MKDIKFIVLLILMIFLFAFTFIWLNGLQFSVNRLTSNDTLFAAKRIIAKEILVVNSDYQKIMCLGSFPDGRPYVVIHDANHSTYTNIGAGWIDHETGTAGN